MRCKILSLIILFLWLAQSSWSEKIHTIRKGDTLVALGKKYGVAYEEILKANPGLNPNRLKIGRKITIPDPPKSDEAVPSNKPDSKKSEDKQDSQIQEQTSPTSSKPQKVIAPKSEEKIYTVLQGDTLSKIAKLHSLSVEEIKKWNGLKSDMIRIGQKLKVSLPLTQKTSDTPSIPEKVSEQKSETKTPDPDSKKTEKKETPEEKKSDSQNPNKQEAIDDSSEKTEKKSNSKKSPNYVFLSPVIRQIKSPRKFRKWKYIIVHNSGTKSGNAKIFNYYHLNVRGMENGLAYHFVIGNGTDSGDGEIEIGSRWMRQLQGGHVASDQMNEIAIGICLVGDFNVDRPTRKQIASLVELINYLNNHYNNPKFKVHREINTRPTDCPGKYFPVSAMHKLFG